MDFVFLQLERVDWPTGENSAFYILVVVLMVIAIIYCLLQYSALRLLMRREWMAKLLRPENFCKGSIWQEFADTLRAWFVQAAEPASANSINTTQPDFEFLTKLGAGDLCDVHLAVVEGRELVLKMPCVAGCDALLRKEQHILQALQRASDGDLYGEYFPLPALSWWHGDRFTAAYAWQKGFVSAEEMRRRYPNRINGRHIAWMFNRTLEALGFAHRRGWIHGAVLPPHLLFHPETHGLQLIDWIHAERNGQPLQLVSRKYKAWYPPECQRRGAATPTTDIYLAAQSMLWLAGGDPLKRRMPDHLPVEVRSFLARCLAESPTERPQDAWLLHDEFRELLETVYGPPQFCHLPL